MADKAQARLLVKEYFISIDKEPLPEHDVFLAKLASMPDDEFQALVFPTNELQDGGYMECSGEEYIKTTTPGIPLELFSDFCHSFVYSSGLRTGNAASSSSSTRSTLRRVTDAVRT